MIQLYRLGSNGRAMLRINDIEPTSVEDLFLNLDSYLRQLKEQGLELTNLFYTVNESGSGDREFAKFTTLFFDIDHADVTKPDEYFDVVLKVIGGEKANWTVVSSGHGFHFISPLTPRNHWDDDKAFTRKKMAYRRNASEIEKELLERGLPGSVDTNVFDRARVLRVPGTINHKERRDPVGCTIHHLGFTPFDFHLEDTDVRSGGEKARAPRSKPDRSFIEWFGDNDEEFIVNSCEAIKMCRSDGAKVDEPMWYAIDSIVGRFKDGRGLIHQWAKSHPSYDEQAVDKKITQALEASGPRTCEHIEGLWDGCKSCPFYRKVKSPIQLKGPDFISTLSTGFHTVTMNENGRLTHKPAYDDLIKFFGKTHGAYVALDEQRAIRVWKGTHYEPITDISVEGFAQDHFKPSAEEKMRKEFAKRLQVTERKSVKWFKETTEGKLNLKNGVYDLRRRILSPKDLDPHTPEMGFTAVLPFEFDPSAKCPLFDSFMASITQGNKELETTILYFLAYALSGERCINEKIMILHGEGANGKSTLLRIMRGLFGETMVKMKPQDTENPFERIRLDGALACVMEEVPSWKDKDFWELMKDLASGGEITVSKKFKDSFVIENRAKFILTCNKLPGGTDPSFGFFRRLLLIPLNARFEDGDGVKDPRIGDKIIAGEMPGVLNRLLAAYADLTKKDFMIPEPQAAKEAMEEYKVEIDNVLAWSQDVLRAARGDENKLPDTWPDKPTWLQVRDGLPMVFVSDMYDQYSNWARMNGYSPGQIAHVQTFGKRLKELFRKERTVIFTQRRFGGSMHRVIVGVLPAHFEGIA